jgi:hypothetical protein
MGKRVRDNGACLGLLGSKDPVGHLEHGHPYSEPRDRLRDLGTDRSPADHHEGSGHRLDADRVTVGPVRRVREPVDRRHRWRRARVQHHPARRLEGLTADIDRARSLRRP